MSVDPFILHERLDIYPFLTTKANNITVVLSPFVLWSFILSCKQQVMDNLYKDFIKKFLEVSNQIRHSMTKEQWRLDSNFRMQSLLLHCLSWSRLWWQLSSPPQMLWNHWPNKTSFCSQYCLDRNSIRYTSYKWKQKLFSAEEDSFPVSLVLLPVSVFWFTIFHDLTISDNYSLLASLLGPNGSTNDS